ncbi:MAG: arginine--tRNA ligase [Planctomycetes bacterium]|nr:arginine--tRNA ligase [Planctomycetota bacterium]
MNTTQTQNSPRADPTTILDTALRRAITTTLGDDYRDTDPLIRPSQRPQLGDFQANAAMSLAKRLGRDPRKLAQQIAKAATNELSAIAEPPEVAGPGFINIRLKPKALAEMLTAVDTAALGITPDPDTRPIAIDLCGVNIAKQMHVGHLRSTIIGDALARILERRGREVHRENHLGDWGLTIAMVLRELRASEADLDALVLDDLDAAYRRAQHQCARDTNADAAAKEVLVALQQGDADVRRDWQKIIDVTMRAVYESFDLLGVKLGPQNNRPESSYRDQLPEVVDAFIQAGIAQEDQGALIIRFDDRDRPLIIRKSDGGYLYSTTDLAAVRYRVQQLEASRVIYVVDARQRDHFRDVFDAVRRIGWDLLADGTRAQLVHVPFGAVLGTDRTPLKTRSGENVPLTTLLKKAIDRGTLEVKKRAADPAAPTHGLDPRQLAQIGRAVGIGAVKYADLSSDLVRDYVFNLDRMIAFEGNTGPYLQYAHARVCSIFAKANVDPQEVGDAGFVLKDGSERQLALLLLRYAGVVADTARTLEPHRLCTFLYDLANAYSSFYERCPVLKAQSDPLRRSRLRLCGLVRRVLADGLDLLGIEAPQRM